ncbi:MAG: MotA/TolQ/ExbB proton channel family protein [Phycisphaerales bacterium]
MTRRWAYGLGAAVAAVVTPAAQAAQADIWKLFVTSFDAFTIVLITGSVVAGAYIFRAVMEVRGRAILPAGRIEAMQDMIRAGRFRELRGYVERDRSFPGSVLRAAMKPTSSRQAARDAAELAASEEIAGWFRLIEPLNIIGNLGPLIGLAGTVWGMILAFTSLGEAGGQANPAELSVGISKALFHTLLGLCLAIPCLVVFGYYRSVIDRHCTRAMVLSAEMVERLPDPATDQGAASGALGGV